MKKFLTTKIFQHIIKSNRGLETADNFLTQFKRLKRLLYGKCQARLWRRNSCRSSVFSPIRSRTQWHVRCHDKRVRKHKYILINKLTHIQIHYTRSCVVVVLGNHCSCTIFGNQSLLIPPYLFLYCFHLDLFAIFFFFTIFFSYA